MLLSIFFDSKLTIQTTGKPPTIAIAPQLMGLMGLPRSMLTTVSPTPHVKQAHTEVVVMRVLIMFFIAISLLIALNPPTFIAQLMGISWGALAGAFLAPFMLGLYWRGVTTVSVWACFIWGVGLTVINMLLGNPINPINCGAIAMVGGFPVVWLVSLLSPKMNRETVDKIFECYQ